MNISFNRFSGCNEKHSGRDNAFDGRLFWCVVRKELLQCHRIRKYLLNSSEAMRHWILHSRLVGHKKRRQVFIFRNLGHEIGHHLGCDHDRDHSFTEYYPYGHGYYVGQPPNGFRTIMA